MGKAKAIFDGSVVEVPDTRFDYDEDRFIAYGLLEDIVLAVVYTERGETTRLISAGLASRKERIKYYEEIKTENPG